jgi:hypothetical protein
VAERTNDVDNIVNGQLFSSLRRRQQQKTKHLDGFYEYLRIDESMRTNE